ncbi:hypothetical protein RD792_000632 [Penstemon davidsonii]|uniref:Lariat debranching enzyme C-terminal domain-containing protein n=1 Tax=Penstemon davidsonii TaxID=160366 RepID=A0ABR0DL73_9LAMI|nr:hypothetical protein RD792_000632 [Penstemon davidsonii]
MKKMELIPFRSLANGDDQAGLGMGAGAAPGLRSSEPQPAPPHWRCPYKEITHRAGFLGMSTDIREPQLFSAVRNEKDLESLNVPLKFRSMNSFWKYYSGEKAAPFPTIFIGGNHEASNYLWELYYGGWAAPQIYFLGFAGVVKFGNVRIGGLSGIYKSQHYYSGHYEKLPYNEQDIRSIYHVREYDVHKLMQVEEPIDVFLSHDWPLGITDCGNVKNLLHRKPFFEQEIREGTLGNRAAAELMAKLKPSYWFSAHLHCKFAALVKHGDSGRVTKFLALDKCLPGRNFMQIFEIESEAGPYEFHYDEEWLAITRKFNPLFPLTKMRVNFSDAKLGIQECRQFVRNKLQMRGSKPFDFVQTAPCHNPSQSVTRDFHSGSFDYSSEDIPIDDVDDVDDADEQNETDDAET